MTIIWFLLNREILIVKILIFHKAVTTLCRAIVLLAGCLIPAKENNSLVDVRDHICVTVIKPSECFPYARERRNKAKCIARFSDGNWSGLLFLHYPLFFATKRDDDPPIWSMRTFSRARGIREFAVPMRRATILHHHVYSNAVITLHVYTLRYVLCRWRRNNVTDRRDSRHAAHNTITCAKLWDIFAGVFSASTWVRQIMMSYCNQCITFARAYTRERATQIWFIWNEYGNLVANAWNRKVFYKLRANSCYRCDVQV